MSFEETLESIVRKVVREELQKASSPDRPMSPQEVAAYLGYDVKHIYRLKRERKLKGFKLGDNSLRFYQSEVERFVQARAQ
jgi:excisionase family DNA binding protein